MAAKARDEREALALVRRTTASALARDIVIGYIAQHANEPGLAALAAALSALGEHDAAEAARAPEVADIGRKRGRRQR